MQLDADEDGEPFFKPPVLAPGPNPLLSQPHEQQQQQQHQQQQQAGQEQRANQGVSTVEPGGAGVAGDPGIAGDQVAAALATVEQEE